MSKGIKIEHKIINNIECKLCPKCDQWLNLENFAKDKTRWDQLRDRCKECRKTTRNTKQEEEYRLRPGFKEKKAEYDKSRIRDYDYEYQRALKNIPNFQLMVNLRSRLYHALKDEQKSGSAVQDLGCSVEDFIKYIESKFYPHPITGEAMTWENWGRNHNTWQIDHIVELHRYDLSDREQFLKACHYTNMQPLWYEDHIKKGTKPKKKID
jgi:hypothetical protein